jgi:hypothetical protein
VRTPEGMRPFEKPAPVWEDNNTIILNRGWDDTEWIHLADYMNKW